MTDLDVRWRDPIDLEVHSVSVHGVSRRGEYQSAETACGIACSGPLDVTDEPITCEACVEGMAQDALQEAERILALRGRVRFIDPNTGEPGASPPGGSALVFYFPDWRP
jgi:hypothetical protein